MTATATLEGIKTIPVIPEQGMRYFSVNAALVNVGEVWQIAKSMDFLPELVQIPYRTGTEIHVLLWHGQIIDTPADMREKHYELANQVNNDAIRYSSGAWSRTVA